MFEKKLLESSEYYDKKYRNFATMVIFPVLGLFLFILLFLFVGKTEITLNAGGNLTPQGTVTQVLSTSDSPIIINNLSEGAQVKKNDLLLQYDGTGKGSQLLAASSGILHLLGDVTKITSIPAGTEIAYIYPPLQVNEKVGIQFYISATEISAVRKGQAIRFSVSQKLPKPLILTGTITQIDGLPTQQNNANYFKVQAETTVTKNTLPKLMYGLQGNVVVVTGKKTFFDYFKDRLLGNE